MKKLLLGSVALAAMLAGPAMAADMPVKARPVAVTYYDWSGFYLGFSVGWGQAEVDRFYPFDPTPTGCCFSTRGDDLVYDVHVGAQYHWMWGAGYGVVIGIEGGITHGNRELKGTTGPLPPPFAADIAGYHKVTSIYQLGARLGWTWDRWMVYGTAGWAGAQVDGGYQFASTGVNRNCIVALGGGQFCGDSWNSGWFVGVGVEAMIHKGSLVDVVVGAEYTHYEFDDERAFCVNSATACVPGTTFDFDHRNVQVDVVRARLSIKTQGWGFFWGGAPAVVAKN
jgi:outer membrane immunogenic protein